ncbi:hypothetical protein QJQ45_024789 [Haematococcus lacustris]|nr:hypothetical protein QJQ45_024789 [Haematococcus lacustris]
MQSTPAIDLPHLTPFLAWRSVVIFSTSRRYAKVVCNASSPQAVLCTRNELCPSAELPTVVTAIATCRPVQLDFTAEYAKGQELGVDCQLLKDEAGCTSFVVIPLVFAKEVLGALMLAGSETLDSGWPNHWVASFWPWVAMYAAEVKAVRLVDLLEKIQTAPSLNSLAWVVTNELDDWFEWTVREHTEARLVLLSEDTSSALVLSHAMVNTKSRPAPMRCSSSLDPMMRTASSNALAPGMTTDPTIIPHPAGWSGKTHLQPDAAAGLCKSAPTSGVSALPFGNDTGAVAPGPQLPLSKQPGLVPSLGASPATPFLCGDPGFALTARQLAEHGLLGTHMSLLNTLTRRCLVEGSKLLYVADVMAALKKYGEPWKDIFLDQARVLNPLWVIAAPIIANEKHLGAIIWLSNSRVNPAMLANAARTSVPPLLHSLAEQLQQVTQHVTQLRSQNSGMANDETPHFWDHLLSGTGLELGTAKNSVSSSHGLEILDFDYRPVKYSMAPSDAASTSALMKVYQSVIAQHQHAQTPPEFDLGAQYEEIEVIAKAGQGAFGSVYVAMWKGMLVAVKVMKQQLDGRRAMRTAWELAVTKALQHSNVVAVHMVLTDVLVEKFSKRIIRFIPSSLAADAQSSSWGSSMGVPTLSAAIGQDKESQPRCQVIIMEYCNLGPLHHYMAERRFMRQFPAEPLKGITPATAATRPAASAGTALSIAHSHPPQPHPPNQSSHSSGSSKPSSGSNETGAPQVVDMPMVIATLLEVAEALNYLHSQGFIHCDLKPENILLRVAPADNRGFTAKVSDFGLSDLSTSDGSLVMGELGGTVTHIAPELVTQRKASGFKWVSKMCDVYSFGICMWELYTGQRPYIDLLQSSKDKRSRDKLILSKVAHEHRRPAFPSCAPVDYVALATHCWHPSPDFRPTFQVTCSSHHPAVTPVVYSPATHAHATMCGRTHPHVSRPTTPIAMAVHPQQVLSELRAMQAHYGQVPAPHPSTAYSSAHDSARLQHMLGQQAVLGGAAHPAGIPGYPLTHSSQMAVAQHMQLRQQQHQQFGGSPGSSPKHSAGQPSSPGYRSLAPAMHGNGVPKGHPATSFGQVSATGAGQHPPRELKPRTYSSNPESGAHAPPAPPAHVQYRGSSLRPLVLQKEQVLYRSAAAAQQAKPPYPHDA